MSEQFKEPFFIFEVSVAPQQEACNRLLPRRPAPSTAVAERRAPQRSEPVSLYVAQGMYRKFPSHLSHHDDILVQKVQNILGLCDAFSQESSKRSDQNASVSLPDEILSVPKDSSREEATLRHPERKEELVLLNYLEAAHEMNAADVDGDNELGSNLK